MIELSERDIQRQITDYLKARGLPCMVTHSPHHKPATRGIADILSSLPGGRIVAIECKGPRGKLTPWQREYRDKIIASGGLWIEAHSLDDVRRELEK